MKILMIGKYYHPSHGGIETALRNLALGLRDAGEEVTVLCSSERPVRSDERIEGIRVIRSASYGKLFSQPLNFGLPAELRRLVREHDILHLHSPNPLAETATLAFAGDKPLVLSYHSDIVRQRLLVPFYAPLFRAFLDRTSRVGVATASHIRHSPFLRGLAHKCDIIPYGIDPALYEADAGVLESAAKLRQELGRFVLFVGRLVGYKGVPVLLEAMRDIEARLVVLGTGPLRSELEARARELGLEQRVRFTGFLEEKAALAYYHAAELLVLPSISKAEAFGLVQVEAMACRKPVISTRLDSGVTEVNDDGVTGLLVPPGDPAALAGALRELLTNEERRVAMGQAARRRFEAHFTRERMVSSYRDLYRRVISSYTATSPST
ncbi:MAG: glycosyltransferase [Oligoflexia bacterium]|nr:glycosyltransferase [Oligoflexia bacterium]